MTTAARRREAVVKVMRMRLTHETLQLNLWEIIE